MTITEFLLARIAEDEKAALLATVDGDRDALPVLDRTAVGSGIRLRATMRRLAVLHPFGKPFNRIRATTYADHPDYDEEWRL